MTITCCCVTLFNTTQSHTPWCRVLLEKLTGLQLVKKFPAFRGTRRFITALTSVRHLSLSWASPIQSIYPHPTCWTSILILSSLFVCCAIFTLETLPSPPGDPSGGVVYHRIVLSPEQASHMWMFLNISVLQGGVVSTLPKPQAGGPPQVKTVKPKWIEAPLCMNQMHNGLHWDILQ